MEGWASSPRKAVPPRALAISLAALAVPVLVNVFLRGSPGDHGVLLWLLALVPAFLLAYHRGWSGTAIALAVGMVAIAATEVVAAYLGRGIQDRVLFVAVIGAFIGISLGVGLLTERLNISRREVERLALTDELTGLPNRRHAMLVFEREFAAAVREGRPLSVVVFDLDRFKDYNDRYGHGAGDEALRTFAEVLRRTTRRMNISARFGGEEFVCILSGTHRDGARTYAERIRSHLAEAPLPAGPLTASAGIAAYEPGVRDESELLSRADQALYQAKNAGRDRVAVYDSDSATTTEPV